MDVDAGAVESARLGGGGEGARGVVVTAGILVTDDAVANLKRIVNMPPIVMMSCFRRMGDRAAVSTG